MDGWGMGHCPPTRGAFWATGCPLAVSSSTTSGPCSCVCEVTATSAGLSTIFVASTGAVNESLGFSTACVASAGFSTASGDAPLAGAVAITAARPPSSEVGAWDDSPLAGAVIARSPAPPASACVRWGADLFASGTGPSSLRFGDPKTRGPVPAASLAVSLLVGAIPQRNGGESGRLRSGLRDGPGDRGWPTRLLDQNSDGPRWNINTRGHVTV